MALVPLTFALGYYADLTYGSKMHRIQGNYVHHHGARVRSPLERGIRAQNGATNKLLESLSVRAFGGVFVSTSSLGSTETLYMPDNVVE